MQSDKLTHLEKWTLASLGAGNAFNILLFAMGATLADASASYWIYLRALFAVVQFVAFDLTIITTVQAMRDGRRSWWAGATVFVASLAAVLISIDVSTYRLPFVHAAYAIVLPLFMLHVAAPKKREQAPAIEVQPTITTVDEPAPKALPESPSIAYLIDTEGLSFADAGRRLSISRQAAQARYKKEQTHGGS